MLNFWTKNEDFEQCVRRSSFAAEDAKCLGKRHWNIEGKSGTKENESRIEVVLFRDILGIKRYENCTIKVSGWILKPIAEFTALKMRFCFCLLEILF